ncbi:MAG: 3'-5' exonuclease [marine benthic group bacterium]|nr:3'-5' exonuclease [Gemmatimonadota bacterium]MCL7976384.1 3'-5' exonuclease [Gemmatimonadota bacterium]
MHDAARGAGTGRLSEPGVGFRPQSELVRRAVETIDRAPIATQELAREVFGIQMAPAGLASRLVFDLLADDHRVTVDTAGVWSRAVRPHAVRDRRLSEIEFAVVDVETTGGSPARGDRIVEFACVHVRNGELSRGFETLVNPGLEIPRWITGLTGIDDRLVEPAPRFEDVADRVRSELEGRIFVAHNVSFDWRFVSEELRHSRAEVPEGERLCTIRLARRAVPGLRRRGLDALARYYGVEIEGRHRAGGDAWATAVILVRMLEAASRQGIESWQALEAWLAGRPASRVARQSANGAPGTAVRSADPATD